MESSISSKKWTNKFDFTTVIPKVDLFLFIFWRKSTTPKNHFEINWPLQNTDSLELFMFVSWRKIVSKNKICMFILKPSFVCPLLIIEATIYVVHTYYLTISGMRGDTFTSLYFLDQILSAELLSKISKLFWRWKLASIGRAFFLVFWAQAN